MVWLSSDFLRVEQGFKTRTPCGQERRGILNIWGQDPQTPLGPTPAAASLSLTEGPHGISRNQVNRAPYTLSCPSLHFYSSHLVPSIFATRYKHGWLNCNTQNPTTVMATDGSSPEIGAKSVCVRKGRAVRSAPQLLTPRSKFCTVSVTLPLLFVLQPSLYFRSSDHLSESTTAVEALLNMALGALDLTSVNWIWTQVT